MNQRPGDQSNDARTPAAEPMRTGADTGASRRHGRRAWPLVVGLVGLLGVVWAVAIVSRYPNLLTG